jgi:hypothetical protein
MHLIPQSWAHVHMLVGVFPSFGLLCVLGFYIGGFFTGNEGIKRICLMLFAAVALLSVPTYLSGEGSMSAVSGVRKVSDDITAAHYRFGMAALAALVLTGIAAVVALIQSQRASRAMFYLVSGLAIVSLGLMVAAKNCRRPSSYPKSRRRLPGRTSTSS